MGCSKSKVYLSERAGHAETTNDATNTEENISHTSASALRQALVQPHRFHKITEDYDLGSTEDNRLGEGSTGTVRKIYHKVSREPYALKTIELNRLSPETRTSLFEEVKIMQILDHPNIIKLVSTYVTTSRLFIVMECCTGGELYDKLYEQPNNRFSEIEARDIAMKVVSALKYLHQNGISHRDLKLENFIFSQPGPHGEIKMIDFGLSSNHLIPNQYDCCPVGTCYYMAPEVVEGTVKDVPATDMWSFGVLMFMLMSGSVPFGGSTDEEIFQKIVKVDFAFNQSRWKIISEPAKHFIRNLLVKDPSKRMTAAAAVHHEFLNHHSAVTYQQNTPVAKLDGDEYHCITNLRKFRNYGLFKQAALVAVAFTLRDDEVSVMRRTFQKLDKEKNGVITYSDFTAAMNESGLMKIKECQRVFESVDQDHVGFVKYSEFLAACIDEKSYFDDRHIEDAFHHLDVDHRGYISKESMKEVLQGHFKDSDVVFDRIWDEVDEDHSGGLNLHEFRNIVYGHDNRDFKKWVVDAMKQRRLCLGSDDEDDPNEKSGVID